MLSKVKLFDSHISTGSYGDFLEGIIQLAISGKSSYACFANAHMLMEAYDNKAFNQVVNAADIVSPDGKPISVLMRLRHGIPQERACGMDLFPDILRRAEQEQLSVFFYGTTDEVLAAVKTKANKEFPTIKIAGSYSPPFRALSDAEDENIAKMINNSGANLVFVALGCPKQEKWMHAHKGRINACMLGLGQAFLTYAGLEKRLPKWIRNLSLEWVYRLYLEPQRLWKRYLIGNSKFLYRSVKSFLP